MTHDDYIKRRDEILKIIDIKLGVAIGSLVNPAIEESIGEYMMGIFTEAAQAIDALVLQVVGDNEPYLRGRQFYASPKAFKNAAIKIENELRIEQRKTVQGDK